MDRENISSILNRRVELKDMGEKSYKLGFDANTLFLCNLNGGILAAIDIDTIFDRNGMRFNDDREA